MYYNIIESYVLRDYIEEKERQKAEEIEGNKEEKDRKKL